MIKRVARTTANLLLWIAAAIGVSCGALWLANLAGLVQPLVVISGSMEPAIMTGDLLFATRAPATEVAPGEVVTLPSTQTGKLVTHRVVSVTEVDGGHEIVMKGDANEYEDGEIYRVPTGETVARPHHPGCRQDRDGDGHSRRGDPAAGGAGRADGPQPAARRPRTRGRRAGA